uniref:Homeobox domain-containing protein n=2 Tax=Leptocylindrus danicus TaxID=163516 RepID=A0A7S2KCG9_9STRA|mmetsp:Transcript_20661/g.30738  ORF Transcript_20661/g.30738 Transcript_20661/m.30738 type:complete len:418 (+) Transcript_20661:225-1478(+)|eukprot:CAMPEP_0116030374 /NCGR_PEP_ID=MMETSP0321-20121206/16816_1 /TAXON_ID=163516 /ORGANISM="Leptocylindrus danicus var. danicus, Strain B650" /LENGTH=417 /DNA_ID=CAMNT_0003505167 /DNA_START=147 /DNA_END=1400 /DNA_ORIENTATION=+
MREDGFVSTKTSLRSARVSAIQAKPARKSSHSSLPPQTVEYLKNWMMSPAHISHPYPTEAEKAAIMADTGIEMKQLTNWFVNNRKRFWKPRIEAAQKSGVAPYQIFGLSAGLSSPSSMFSVAPAVVPVSASHGNTLLNSKQDIVVSNHDHTDVDLSIFGGSTATDLSRTSPRQGPCPVSDSSHTNYSSDDASVDDCCASSCSSSNSNQEEFDLSAMSVSCKDELHENGLLITRREVVDVHILKPTASGATLPSIKDVTILSKVQQSERVLQSYVNCDIEYTFAKKVIGNRKKVQSRRDAEVVRVKKHYLRQYLSTIGNEVNEVQAPSEDKDDNFNHAHNNMESSISREQPLKRVKLEDAVRQYKTWKVYVNDSPSKKTRYVNKNLESWKEACKCAKHGYCDSLPSLEEATRMFGYCQ